MSGRVSEKYCHDCMFHKFGIEEGPCKGCADSLPHPRFKPALKEGDLIELAGAVHRVARSADLYWLHRDLPAHNLQLFFDAGMSMDQVNTFFQSVDKDIEPEGSWPFMSMLQLVRCVYAIQNDCRFNPVKPVTVEDTRMPRGFKTFKNAEELKGKVLQEGDEVVFTALGESVPYLVDTDYLDCRNGWNSRVFDMLDMPLDEKEQFAEEAYGYSLPKSDGLWPYCRDKDYAALTRLCLALYEKIDPTPVVLKSADDVLKYGLKHGTKILFPGNTYEHTVEGRPEVFSYGLYLNADLGGSNSYIFDELNLDRYEFCSMMYGYKHKDGDWPETDGEDYPALTRAVVCLMHLAEARSQTRETAEVKDLRANLAELVAQRESYEEDVQAAKQTVQEAEEAASQARLALSYDECALETLQEDIDGLEEAIEEALAGK